MGIAKTPAGRDLEHKLGRAKDMLAAIREAQPLTREESKRSALGAAEAALSEAEGYLSKRLKKEIASEEPHANLVKARIAAENAMRAADALLSEGTDDRAEALRRRDELDIARQLFILREHQEKESTSLRGMNASVSAWSQLWAKIESAQGETDKIVRQLIQGDVRDRLFQSITERPVRGAVEAGLRLALEPAAHRRFAEEIEKERSALKAGETKVYARFGGLLLEPAALQRLFDQRFTQIWAHTMASDRAVAAEHIARAVRLETEREIEEAGRHA